MHKNNVPHSFHCAFWQNVMKCVSCPPHLNFYPSVQRLCFMSLRCPAWDTSNGTSILALLTGKRANYCLWCCCCYYAFIWRDHCCCVRMIQILLHRRHMLIMRGPQSKLHMWRMSLIALSEVNFMNRLYHTNVPQSLWNWLSGGKKNPNRNNSTYRTSWPYVGRLHASLTYSTYLKSAFHI